MPDIKSSLEVTDPAWLPVLVLQNQRKVRTEQSYYWGQPKKIKIEINNLPPRIMWLCLDFTLATVHRYVA